MHQSSVRSARGFSLIELLLVIFIMALLTIMAVPALTKLTKTSRVQQASQQVLTMLWQARSEAERYRDPVVVFFGDDPALLPVQPIADVMPPKGRMEIWSCQRGVNQAEDDGLWDETPPYWVENPTQQCPAWYPHRVKLNNLTPIAGSLPENVRIICGNLLANNDFRCLRYRQDSVGELKRHQVVYGRNGVLAEFQDPNWNGYPSYNLIVVYDETSGDYQLILISTGGMATRPKLIPNRLNSIDGKPLTNQLDLPKMLSQIAPDS